MNSENLIKCGRRYALFLEQDEFAENPREMYDHLGTIVSFSSSLNIGDGKNARACDPEDELDALASEYTDDLESLRDYWYYGRGHTLLQRDVNKIKDLSTRDKELGVNNAADKAYRNARAKILDKYYVIVPIYAYVHSGTMLSTQPFSDPWDSGCAGMIYVNRYDAMQYFGLPKTHRMTSGLHDKIVAALKAEVEELSAYISGNVYCVTVRNCYGDVEESIGGFYGDRKLATDEGTALLEACEKRGAPAYREPLFQAMREHEATLRKNYKFRMSMSCKHDNPIDLAAILEHAAHLRKQRMALRDEARAEFMEMRG